MILCKVTGIIVFAIIITMLSSFKNAARLPLSRRFKYRSMSSPTIRSQQIVEHPSFDKVESFHVQEFGLNGAMYRHKKSGAQVISVNTADDNKVFGITFRTPPKDSTGVPHVLEHSVLCGSRKFPVKEPFVDLLRGSLQNFLNAFTYPDRTCYPVASTNTKDFYNLVHVYLDAVLHPRAVSDPQVLQQEGWHYELENDHVDGALSIKGVVYNEMKGVYSSPDSLLGRATQQALFPDNAYSVDSGGDPLKIPDLSFQQFKDFHAQYYHPSNSRVFFYGNDDPLQRLVLLDEYLQHFDAISDVSSRVQYQAKLHDLKRVEVNFPISPGTEPKHMITLNWVLNHAALSPRDALALGVLDQLLLGTSTAALKKILTESGFGESVNGGGLSEELLQATYSVGMKGVQESDVSKVEDLVQTTIADLAKKGFEADAVEAAMNTYEFKLREFNTGGFPKGLAIMLGMVNHWIYDKPALDGVRFEAPLKELKDDLAAGKPVFQDLLRRYFVENTHRVAVQMKPDADLEARRLREEEMMLAELKKGMTSSQLEKVLKDVHSLREAQEAPDSAEARATLPRLALEDIDPLSKELPSEVLSTPSSADATVLAHHLETSGILYVDVAFDYSAIDEADLELIPLFTRMIMEAGTAHMDSTTLSRKIGAHTGGVSLSLHNDLKSAGNKVVNTDDALLYLVAHGKAVTEKVPILFALISDILLTANFSNQKRAVEMLKESKARKESAVLSSGHTFAATRLGSRSSFLGHLNEVTGGLTSVRAAGPLLDRATSDWPSVQARLETMREAIVRKGKGAVVVNLTGNQELIDGALPTVDSFVASLPAAGKLALPQKNIIAEWKQREKLPRLNEAFVMPSQVNYVGLGGSILPPGAEVKGSYSVASRYLSTGYLWDQVRVVGGAYGGFARFSPATGRFLYLSYRDPNCINTIDTYDGTAAALSEAELSSEDLLQAVIGTIGDLDGPMTADQKGFAALEQFLSGETAEDRQKWRTSILQTQASDFKDFAARLGELRSTGRIVVFGAQQAIDTANAKLPDDRKLKVESALAGLKEMDEEEMEE